MVRVIDWKQFKEEVLDGGLHSPSKEICDYEGKPYECGCGNTHKYVEPFSTVVAGVPCESWSSEKYILLCTPNLYATVVQTKGWITSKFVSLVSTNCGGRNNSIFPYIRK